ncbi:MAG: hypothetical protein QOD60_1272 [Solirubrobacterales bacterium]|nr:hypothetical protein [Solirubrobacterales bacterium]
MRWSFSAALAVLALAGCSGGPQEPKSLPPPPVPANGSNQSTVGGSIRLAASSAGSSVQMRVTVDRVVDPVEVGAADVTITKGARFVGVFISLLNVGQANYDESPLADASLVTSGGAKVLGEQVLGGPCADEFASHVKIPPGATHDGCIVFEVPAGQKPAVFQYALDSGFGQEVGMWQLK